MGFDIRICVLVPGNISLIGYVVGSQWLVGLCLQLRPINFALCGWLIMGFLCLPATCGWLGGWLPTWLVVKWLAG